MAALDDGLKILGVGTPFVYAAATYGLFHWLDEKASDEAKESISSVLEVKRYNTKKVASAFLEVFDRLYSTPLLHWQAFLREPERDGLGLWLGE